MLKYTKFSTNRVKFLMKKKVREISKKKKVS